jgi:steroid delta-isomerase-like uncharacterized protein
LHTWPPPGRLQREDRAVPAPREVVARLIETVNAHDPVAGRELFAKAPRLVAASGRVIDLDGLGQVLRTTVAAFPDFQLRVERWIVDGDTVVTEDVLEGTHKGTFAGIAPTGRKVSLPMMHLYRVADGRITERVAYHDTAGILRQLSDPD